MTVKLLALEKEMVDRMLKGCKHYDLKAKHNFKTKPYVYVEVNNEDDVVNIFWLGANLSHPKIETALTRSSY